MPYIKQDQRDQWKKLIDSLVTKVGSNQRRLSYLFMALTNKLVISKSYANYQTAFGFLNCVSYECARRIPSYSSPKGLALIPLEEFDIEEESRQIDTIFVHSSDKDSYGGHLNYIISSIINELLLNLSFRRGQITKILEHVTERYYVEIVGPYEDKKIRENGDVYDSTLTTSI